MPIMEDADNGEREDVDGENVSPAAPPVAFGEESTSLAVGNAQALDDD